MTCIPNHKYCDDISDCPDSSDEMSCPTTTVSKKSKIKISKQFNFWDSSSPKKVNYKFIKIMYLFVYFQPIEPTTTTLKPVPICKNNEYYCPSYNLCFILCNSVLECPELSKEITCPDCSENGFRCDDSKLCISNSLICDGKDDCSDGSDEKQQCNGKYFDQNHKKEKQ